MLTRFSGILGVLSFTLFLASPDVRAYSLAEHIRITRAAVREFNACYPDAIDASSEAELIRANLGEDIHLARKWLRYSHFYNPRKKLDQWRADASVRVEGLQHKLEGTIAPGPDLHSDLGHLIHHIQDMTSPPHVVPVMHSLFDGYESYSLSERDYAALASEGVPCRLMELTRQIEPSLLLQETALATLEALEKEFQYERSRKILRSSFSEAFWKESGDSSFGVYGFLGDSFGKPVIFLNSEAYMVSPSVYRDFKMAQVRLAIDATRQALLWGYSRMNAGPNLSAR